MSSNLKNDLSNAGKHDFNRCGHVNWATQSVGVFQWVLTSNGKRLKKTAAKVRVIGPGDRPDLINAKANEIRLDLDKGILFNKKSIRV